MRKVMMGAALVGATMVFGAGAACAQDQAGGRGGRGAAAMYPDTNNDGVTDRAEADAVIATRFAALDADKDGKISAAERGERGRMIERADANGDGTVTLAEMTAQAGKRFDRMDANKDGKIDQAEKDAIRARMQQRRSSAAPAATTGADGTS